MSLVSIEKQMIRKEMVKTLKVFSKEKISVQSLEIQKKLLQTFFFKEAESIALYAAYDFEVRTDHLFDEILKRHRRVAYPKLKKAEHGLDFFWIQSLAQLSVSKLSFLEPDCSKGAREVSPEELDLIVVPGIAFDRACRRLGRGKGLYDHVLRSFQGFSVGLAYSCQLLEKLPEEAWDERLDFLVTESDCFSSPSLIF